MLIKTIEYIDYDGKPQKDVCYFNMTKAEIAGMQVRMNGKFIDHLKDLASGNQVEELFGFFKEIILDSYGEKSEDGKRFYKTPEMRRDFEFSIAFSELITELLQNPKDVAKFTRAILPPDFQNIEIPEDMTGIDDASAPSLPAAT